jgi:hypothetical protein
VSKDRVALGFFSSAFLFTSLVSAMNRETFEHINHLIIDTYAPVVAHKYRALLELNELWQGFGGAFRVDSAQKPLGEARFIITLTGNIPQNKHMNAYGYAIVACHEIGHIVGGPPYQSRSLSRWSSKEGQADYYATNVCMWHYVEHSDKPKDIISYDESMTLCSIFYGDDPDKAENCKLIMSGIIAFKDYFNSTTSKKNPVSLSRFDNTVVEETLDKYPSNQCRLDTMVAGLFNLQRPRCWYKAE